METGTRGMRALSSTPPLNMGNGPRFSPPPCRRGLLGRMSPACFSPRRGLRRIPRRTGPHRLQQRGPQDTALPQVLRLTGERTPSRSSSLLPLCPPVIPATPLQRSPVDVELSLPQTEDQPRRPVQRSGPTPTRSRLGQKPLLTTVVA